MIVIYYPKISAVISLPTRYLDYYMIGLENPIYRTEPSESVLMII